MNAPGCSLRSSAPRVTDAERLNPMSQSSSAAPAQSVSYARDRSCAIFEALLSGCSPVIPPGFHSFEAASVMLVESAVPRSFRRTEQSASSQAGSYSTKRLGKSSPSQAAAGASKPSNCFKQSAHAFRTFHLMIGRNLLPGQQKTHEVGGRNRLDLLTQAIERVAVNAGQQPPRTPFSFRGPGSELAANRQNLQLRVLARRLRYLAVARPVEAQDSPRLWVPDLPSGRVQFRLAPLQMTRPLE